MKGELSRKTVLITGGLGFIGSNFAIRCLNEGARVRVVDCELVGSGANRTNLAGFLDDIELIEGDVRDPVIAATAVSGVDVVLHAAAQTSHTRSMEDSLLTLDVNVRGTLQLLEAIRQSGGDPKFVHVGTTTQLGLMIREPADEIHPEFPRDVYSATMVGSEKFVLIYALAHGLRAAVIRLCNTYGPRAAIHTAELGFVNYFIGLALQRRPITIYGDGKQLRSLIHVDDAVDALYLAATKQSEGKQSEGEVYLVSSDSTLTVAAIGEAIAEHIGSKVSYVPWPEDREFIDVGSAIIDSSKIRQKLGWAPRVDLAQGLPTTANYYREFLTAYIDDFAAS